MSGFLGVYRPDGAAFDERLLNGMLQRLRFRGPDAQNIFVERDFASGCSFLETVPQDWREKLQSRMRAQHLFTLSMTAELFRILDAFSKSHIETLLVKGPIISFLAYGDAALRGYVDWFATTAFFQLCTRGSP